MKLSHEIRATAAGQNDVEGTSVPVTHPDAEAGMSERFRGGGGEIYVPAE